MPQLAPDQRATRAAREKTQVCSKNWRKAPTKEGTRFCEDMRVSLRTHFDRSPRWKRSRGAMWHEEAMTMVHIVSVDVGINSDSSTLSM